MNTWFGACAVLVAVGSVAACSSGSSAPICVIADGGDASGPGCVADGAVRDASRDVTKGHDSGSDGASRKDATSQDSGHKPKHDGGRDAGEDAGFDSGEDAGHDAAHDSGRDAAHDTGHDAYRAPDATPPSCDPAGKGTSFCGGYTDSGQTQNCCDNPAVIGGSFDRAYKNGLDGGAYEAGAPATVASFRLDTYLVTVARFREFVKAVLPAADSGVTAWRPPPGSGKHTYLNGGNGLVNSASPGTYEPGWLASDDANIDPTSANLTDPAKCPHADLYGTWTDTPTGTSENKPINCVNWYEAYAFCIWDYGFLPSDAEYGYAAAGGARQFEYPWGNHPPGEVNQYAIYGCNYPFGNGHPIYDPTNSTCGSTENIAIVGSDPLGAGLWGQLDLAGEVNEWVLDLVNTYPTTCVNCAYMGPATGHFVRGGSFDVGDNQIQSNYIKGEENAGQRSFEVGFRCARAPFPTAADGG